MSAGNLIAAQAPLLVVLAASVLAMLVAAWRGPLSWALSGWLAFSAFLAAAALELFLPISAGPFGASMRSGFSSYAGAVIYLAGALSVLSGLGHMRFVGSTNSEQHSLILLSASGMSAMVMSGDLVIFIIGLELASLPLYVLSSIRRENRYSVESGLKYFVNGAFGTALAVFGAAFLFGFAAPAASPFGFEAIAAKALTPGSQLWLLAVGLALFLSGIAFKIALVPFHMWLPDVYQGAPTPVTTFMAAGIKASVLWFLMRFLVFFIGAVAVPWWGVLCFLAVATMTVGNLAALVQDNVKRMLAYSSMAHTGYIMTGLLAAALLPGGKALEAAGSVGFYLATYTMMTVAAFTIAGVLEGRDGKGAGLADFNGLSKRRPLIALALAVTMFSLGGMPPLAGFFAKFFVFKATVDAGLYWLAVVGVLNSLVSFYYYLRVLVHAYMEDSGGGMGTDRKDPYAVACIVLATAAILWFGLFPSALHQSAVSAVASIAGGRF